MKKKAISIVSMVLCCCVAMALVESVLGATYWVKSGVKIVLFLLAPLIYASCNKGDFKIKSLFASNKKGIVFSLVLGLSVFFMIIGGYFTLNSHVDFSQITVSLGENAGITQSNFLWVFLYISLFNSLLEEFFFRGFSFLTLKDSISGGRAYVFSGLAFSLYHISMMVGWFHWGFLTLIVVGLFFVGVLFDYIDNMFHSIYPSWIIHICANLAINCVALFLFAGV